MPRTRPLIALGVLTVVFVGASAGCYERVVSARGFGSDRMTIETANSGDPVKSTKLHQNAPPRSSSTSSPQRTRIHNR